MTDATEPSTYPLSIEGVSGAMRCLDLDAWLLAEQFEAAGLKGVRDNEYACPIAVRVHQLIPDASAVYVEAEMVRIEGYERDNSGFGFDVPVILSVPLPDGAQDFIQEFDRGEHPQLIEEVTEHVG